MAGRGESCSHVGAVLFALATGVRIRDSSTCTGELCKWLPAHVQNVPYLPVHKIDFTSAKAKKRKLDSAINSGVLQPSKVEENCVQLPKRSPHSKSYRQAFHARLAANPSDCAILRVLPGFCHAYVSKPDPKLPACLRELYSETNRTVPEHDFKMHCKKVFEDMQVGLTEEMAVAIEQATRDQAHSKLWFEQRTGRITASKMRSVCKTRLEKPSISLLKTICYPDEYKFTTQATRWGCTHEEMARNSYEHQLQQSHNGLSVANSGLHINTEFPHIGATPDGIVNCNCCGRGVCEIKCPFCKKQSSVNDIAEDGKHCLIKSPQGEVTLKMDHSFYYQIQTQIFVCKADYCDFVLWTEKDMHVQRILPNELFWDSVLTGATAFFLNVVLPELTAHLYTNVPGVPSNPAISFSVNSKLVCFCNKPESDRMAECTNPQCKIKKYHISCLKMKIGPRSKSWVCRPCTQLAKAQLIRAQKMNLKLQ